MKLCEKSPAKDKNLPLKPIVATRQISRPPVMHAAIPIGDLYFRAFLGLSRTTIATPIDTPVASWSPQTFS